MDVKQTIVDTSVVMLENNRYRDETVTVDAAGVLKAGTLLMRDATTQKLKPYVIAEENRASAVIGFDLPVTAPGDNFTRVIVAGGVRKEKLVIHADESGENITNAVLDTLRDFGIYALDCNELGLTN